MMEWVLRYPARFLRERAEFDELAKEKWLKALDWRLESGSIEGDVDMEIFGITYATTLTYPELFPETRAYIRPRDRSQQWSNHQYGPGGSLCLEWRADNWDSRTTGADLVRSAFKLLASERNPNEPVRVPSAHQLSSGQTVRTNEYRLVFRLKVK